MPYVGLLRSTGTGFWMTRRYDGDIPGWGGLARHDEFFAGDLNGDGRDDLVIFNGQDWSMSYVGLFASSPAGYTMTRLIEIEVSVAVFAVAFGRPGGLAPYPPADRISSRGLALYRGASPPGRRRGVVPEEGRAPAP
jgi:hypothetical protein